MKALETAFDDSNESTVGNNTMDAAARDNTSLPENSDAQRDDGNEPREPNSESNLKSDPACQLQDDESLSFEQALAKLEQIVTSLEDGRLGLTESLQQYERGVSYLRRCHGLLGKVERRIEVLSGFDADGNPVTRDWDDSEQTLTEKAERRGERRTAEGAAKPATKKAAVKKKRPRRSDGGEANSATDTGENGSAESDVDDFGRLF